MAIKHSKKLTAEQKAADSYFRNLTEAPVSPTRISRESATFPLKVASGYYDLRFDTEGPAEGAVDVEDIPQNIELSPKEVADVDRVLRSILGRRSS